MSVNIQIQGPASGPAMLRTLQPADLDWIEHAAHRTDAAFRWRTRGSTPSPDVLHRILWDRVLAQYVVDRGGRPIALLQAYDADERNATCWLAVLAAGVPEDEALADAAHAFFCHLADACAVRRLYMHSLPAHGRAVLPQLPTGYDRQGRLTDFERVPGGFDDLEIVAWSLPLA